MSRLPNQPQMNPSMQLANAAPRPLGKGSLVVFHYMLWKNDPTPVVVVSSFQPGLMMKGVNLHYLSFPYVKRLLALGAGNPGFSYSNIKADRYITSAFRSYSWRGIDMTSIRVLDAEFLRRTMQMVSSFDPLQIRAIRQEIERQFAAPVDQQRAGPSQPMDLGNMGATNLGNPASQ